jgi:hypothetical protein
MQKLAVLVAEIREWLSGKKTYLLAGLLIVTVSTLVFLGRMTPATALTVALVFAGLISASFRSAIEQHHAEIITVLLGISEAGIDLRAGNKAAAVQALEPALEPVAAEVYRRLPPGPLRDLWPDAVAAGEADLAKSQSKTGATV